MGNRVECTVEEVVSEGRPAVQVTCGACQHVTESFGTTERSVRRCLALMREECPEGEDNFYVEKDA